MTAGLNILIGFDVARTFFDHHGEMKNLYQLLREGTLGPFDGKKLEVGDTVLETAILNYMEGDSMTMVFGRILGKDELALADNCLRAGLPFGDFEGILNETMAAFSRLGIRGREPVVHVYFDLEMVGAYPPEQPMTKLFYEKSTVAMLRDGVVPLLNYDPFRNDCLSLENPPEEVDPNKVKETREFQFIMEEMGEGPVRRPGGKPEGSSGPGVGKKAKKKGFLGRLFGK